jgi:hypothetical protein
MELATNYRGIGTMMYTLTDSLRIAIETLFDDTAAPYTVLLVDQFAPDDWYELPLSTEVPAVERAISLQQKLEQYVVNMSKESEELDSVSTEALRMQAIGLFIALRELVHHFPETIK